MSKREAAKQTKALKQWASFSKRVATGRKPLSFLKAHSSPFGAVSLSIYLPIEVYRLATAGFGGGAYFMPTLSNSSADAVTVVGFVRTDDAGGIAFVVP